MPAWRTDDEVLDLGTQIGIKFCELYEKEYPLRPQHDDPTPVIKEFRESAAEFLRLDPQMIKNEWGQAKQLTRNTGAATCDHVGTLLQDSNNHLREWTGDAAEAFKHQLINITVFTNVMREHIVKVAEALYAKAGLAIQIRNDYCTLAQATIEAFNKAIDDADEKNTSILIKIGAGLVKAMAADPKAVTDTGIDLAADVLTYEISGGNLEEVGRSYFDSRSRLLESYYAELGDVAGLLAEAERDLTEQGFSLFEPLPVSVDVRSPNFHYENFYPEHSDPDKQRAPRVEEERKKMLEEQPNLVNPDSPIGRRLAGEGK